MTGKYVVEEGWVDKEGLEKVIVRVIPVSGNWDFAVFTTQGTLKPGQYSQLQDLFICGVSHHK